MKIAGREIGAGHEPYVIAEVGLNHNGSILRAMDMVDIAKWAGCDAVKFQTFKAHGVCDDVQTYTYAWQGKIVTEPRINIFHRSELPDDAWLQIKAKCDDVGITFLSTPQNPSDLDILLKVGVPAIKIGSDDITNHAMIKYCAADDVGLPIILSTGMANFPDIYAATRLLNNVVDYALLVCTSQYPCPDNETNVARILTLKNAFRAEIGFSDHTIGEAAATMAVALGASIIECHMTMDRSLPGPDHEWAKLPSELADYVNSIRRAYQMCGNGSLEITDAERANKLRYQRKEPL